MNLKEYIEESGKMKRVDLEKQYSCDECKKTFAAGTVLLIPEPKNISIGPSLLLGAPITIDRASRRYHLACPECKKVHLFGFNSS